MKDISKFSILLVDDEPQVIQSLKRAFRKQDYSIQVAYNAEDALRILQEKGAHLAILDYKMPGMDGLTLLQKIRENYPQVSVIMLTGHGGIQEAVKAMQLGAVDFLEKPINAEALLARVNQQQRIWELSSENLQLKARLGVDSELWRFVGISDSIQELKRMVARVGPSDMNVLIQGETGSGKELVARGIHCCSERANKPFVPVDCAAISETVMESELFGHVKGAFTGAHSNTIGLIRSADGGTLFLDEIGELSLNMQAKLLRTLETLEVRPVGSHQSYPVNVRIVSATNRELLHEAEKGNFRDDLYYRLNVISILVPPLKERKEDIPVLAHHFLQLYKNKSTQVTGFTSEAMQCMQEYEWPGNVRELENVMRRAVVLCNSPYIMPENLPRNICKEIESAESKAIHPQNDTLDSYEIVAIENALAKSSGNRKMAAKILNIGEATLYRKLKKYRISC